MTDADLQALRRHLVALSRLVESLLVSRHLMRCKVCGEWHRQGQSPCQSEPPP